MIKRTLFFANPVYLSTRNKQLLVKYPEKEEKPSRSLPIEDVGIVVLEHKQITITNGLIDLLLQNNVVMVHCNARHMPTGLSFAMHGHSEHSERFQLQLKASLPLKKNLWQQTIKAKINNQAKLLEIRGKSAQKMFHWADGVQSGDAQNHEARAAAFYWDQIFDIEEFKRGRFFGEPNNLLNYGYAILRAICARALTGSGLLPVMGIHHKSKYNPYCLADDIMEPYRPFVDALVCEIVDHHDDVEELSTAIKTHLLQLPTVDVMLDGKRSPLLIAMSRTTNSLYECFAGIRKKLLYPEFATI